MSETPTSYSLLVMFKDVVYAVRDPYGNRPLCIGRVVPVSKLHSSGTSPPPVPPVPLSVPQRSHRFSVSSSGAGVEDTEGWVVSSESCSFQSIGAKSVVKQTPPPPLPRRE